MTAADPMLTAAEVAEWLRVPLTTLYDWNYKDTGPKRVRYGKKVRYLTSDVEKFINAHRV